MTTTPVRQEYEVQLEPLLSVPVERNLPLAQRLWQHGWLRVSRRCSEEEFQCRPCLSRPRLCNWRGALAKKMKQPRPEVS